VAGESNTIRIGTEGTQTVTYVAGISGATVPGGVGVIIDANGHLGTVVSSERFKDAIKPMDKASEAILSLKPVTFHYKKDLDPESIPQFGLVAEQVAKVDPDLVARDDQGKPYTVRYEAVNVMLLNEFLKEHRKLEEQSSQIAKQDCKVQKLEATVVQLQSALKEQAAQIQKVSERIGAQAPAPRVVAND
jgi:trimeric autotransporter adhesin